MKDEYEAIDKAGFVLQLDCPDLAMSRHSQFPHLTVAGRVPQHRQVHMEVLNEATKNIPPERCACTSAGATTKARTTSTSPLKDIVDIVAARRAPAHLASRAPTRATPTSGTSGRKSSCPMARCSSPASSTPRPTSSSTRSLSPSASCSYAEVVGSENVIAGIDCGFGTFVRPTRPRPPHRLGQAQVAQPMARPSRRRNFGSSAQPEING